MTPTPFHFISITLHFLLFLWVSEHISMYSGNMKRTSLNLAPGLEGNLWLKQGSGQILTSHCHDELELNILTKGMVHYLIAGERVVMQPGSLLWLFPDQEHHLVWSSTDSQLWIGVFTPRLVQFACRSDAFDVLGEADPGEILHRTLPLKQLDRLMQLCDRQPENPDRLNATLHALLISAWDAYLDSESSVSQELHPAVYQVALLIRNEPDCTDLSSLCRDAGLSVSHLSRLFHQQMGETLTEFRSRQRIDYFKQFYGQGLRRTLSEAAEQAGFGSYAQFYRTCIKYLGMEPREYKNYVKQSNT